MGWMAELAGRDGGDGTGRDPMRYGDIRDRLGNYRVCRICHICTYVRVYVVMYVCMYV